MSHIYKNMGGEMENKDKNRRSDLSHTPTRNGIIQSRAVRYDDIYRMDEIKSLSFHILLYRLFCGVAKYIVYGNTFSSFGWLRSLHATTGREAETEAGGSE